MDTGLFDRAILILLGVFSVRQVIAKNINIPLPDKLRWLIYDKDTKPVLCSRAYELQQIVSRKKSSSIIDDLIELSSRHVKYYTSGLQHGRTSAIQSKYFINTLEASYNNDDLETMTAAILALIADGKLGFKEIDFVLCIKGGNQILAHNLYKNDSRVVHVCRIGDYDSHHAKSHKPSNIDSYSLQYENLDALLTMAQQSKDRLNGIVVDCSVSTGGGIATAIKDFNEFVDKNRLKINPIQHAFVLFAHVPYSAQSNHPFTLHRYFDMDEKARELIYKINNTDETVGRLEVYAHLKDKGLLQ